MQSNRTTRWSGLLLGAVAVTGPWLAPAQQLSPADVTYFETKIRPIFANHCYKCHSSAEGKIKGGLSMDSKEGMLTGGNTGPAIVPGNPGESLIMEAVKYANPDLQMPPKGEKLSPQQIADLDAWIKRGAPDPRTGGAVAKGDWKPPGSDHWAYSPVKRTVPPAVQNKDWVVNPIDAFVLGKQEPKGLKPSPEASRPTLIRRAYFDLVGLPPSPEEIKAFVDDQSPNAFEKVVDRLLKSQHYGERWGRYWLDVARYSDTKGDARRGDVPSYPYAWTYRDYVVQAFNQDKPFDQFIVEQIAADQLPAGKNDKTVLAALGFLTLGDHYDGNLNEIVNDRIDTTTKAFLAMTVACARCHDHKFDPIPTADYYSLRGVFISSTEPKELPLLAEPKDTPEYRDYFQQRIKLQNDYATYVRAQLDKVQADFLAKAGPYIMANTPGGNRQELTQEHKLVRETVQQWGRVLNAGRRGNDVIFGPYWQFRALKPNEFATKGRDIAAKMGSDPKKPVNTHLAYMFRRVAPRNMTDVASVYGQLFAVAGQKWQEEMDAYDKRIKAGRGGQPPSGLRDTQYEALRTVMFTYANNPNDDPEEALRRLLPRNVQDREARIRADLAKLEMSHPAAPARAPVMVDKAKPEDSPIFVRGEAGNRGKVVPRQFLEVLAGPARKPFQTGSGRLELARAIATKDNPITARVAVNRIWLHHFGEGIVNTPDDFGTMAEAPSHPGLIDWLATYFMDNGWSQKKLHKVIMMSNTYRQSSEDNPRHAQIDPNNRLLWRANIRRLDFEPLRDSILAIGGTLDLEMGGKPVDLTKDSKRRSIYGYIDRASVPEVMNHFDFATPDMATGKRYQTIVPQQALFLMNSPLVVEQARRAVNLPGFKKVSTDEARLDYIYKLVFQRSPTELEMKLGLQFVNSTPLKDTIPIALATPPPAAQKGKGKAPAARPPAGPQGLDPWGKLVHALFQANEFSFVN